MTREEVVRAIRFSMATGKPPEAAFTPADIRKMVAAGGDRKRLTQERRNLLSALTELRRIMECGPSTKDGEEQDGK